MSGVALEAKSYRALKQLGRKHGIANVNIKKAELIKQIRREAGAPKEVKRSTGGAKYRKMVRKLDPDLYSVLNPILHLLPEVRPLVRERALEGRSTPFSSFLVEWEPWREAYLELDGVTSTMNTVTSYASRVLVPIQDHGDQGSADLLSIVSEEDFTTFSKLFPVLAYAYALHDPNFLLLAVHYDSRDMFEISSTVDPRIKLATGLDIEEKRKLLWEAKSPEVFAFLTRGTAADLRAPEKTPWGDHEVRDPAYVADVANARTTEYVAHYVSNSSARLVTHVLRSKQIVSETKPDIVCKAISWGYEDTEEKVLALIKYGVISTQLIIVEAIENQANTVVSEVLESYGLIRYPHITRGASRRRWSSNEISLLAISLIAENVGAARILIALGADTSIEFWAKVDSKGENFTPLLWAARIGNPILLKVFLDLGLDSAKPQGRDSISALSQAVLLEDAFMVKLMLEYAPNIGIADIEGKTALDYALSGGSDEITSMLQVA